MDRALLKQVILEQSRIPLPADYIERQINSALAPLLKGNLIVIITGIRRCGKSIVLKNIRKHRKESDYYLNFDDDRLVNFTVEDFQTLYEVFVELFGEQKSFYFDEIQNIPGWERFIRRLHEHGNKVFITGSNAAMLSIELGTRLTGRHVNLTMYPYSFFEFFAYKNKKLLENIKDHNFICSTTETGAVLALFNEYMLVGGIPEYVRDKQDEYISSLYDNILYRDIIVRHKLTKHQELKQLVFFIASNIGKKITYNSIRKMLGLGNASTVSEYYNYLEQSFLCFLINEHHNSLKKQLVNEKKQYLIDHGVARLVGFRTSEDVGRMLENIVFIELKRRGQDIYVYNGIAECDFVLKRNNQVTEVIQVCKSISEPETKEREYKGLVEAMQTYKLDQGLILTEDLQRLETIEIDGKSCTIQIMPIWKWLLA